MNSYQKTPQPVTGVPPASMLFKDSMKSTFPKQTLNEINIQEAREKDRKLKDQHNNKRNSSKHRTHHKFHIGERVFARNFNRTQKHDSLFLPKVTEIIGINIVENKLIIRQGDKILCQHPEDLKPYSGNSEPSKNQTSIQEEHSENGEKL